MARLTIEQVAAPDFSDSAAMMRGASDSFNKGMDTAQGILAQYNKGQQAKDDMKAIELIAQQRDEGELDALLASGQLGKLNLSDTLRGNVANLRGDVIGNVADRDANTRGNNAEGRTASEHIDMVAARAERRALTPAAVAAFNEANTTGSKPNQPNANTDFLRYSNQNATRNDPLSEKLVNSMSFLSDMGITMDVSSGGQENNTDKGTGSTRHNHGESADADFYTSDGRKLDWNNSEDIPVFQEIVKRAKANGVTGMGAGDDYMGAGRMHVGFGAAGVWGADGKRDNAPEWLKAAYNGASQGTAGPVTSVGIGGKGYQDYSTKVAASLYQDPAEATTLLTGALNEQRATDTRIAAAEQLRQTELMAQTSLDNLQNRNILTPGGMAQAGFNIPGISASNAIAAGNQGRALGEGNKDILSPTVKADPKVVAAAEIATADAARSNELDPSIQAFEQASAYDAAEGGPGAALVAETGAEATGILAPENVDRALAQFAKNNNISLGQAAVVFNSVAEGNAEQMAAQIEASPDTDMYANLSSIADRMFGDKAKTAYQDDKLADVGNAAQRDAQQANILVEKTKVAKDSALSGSSQKTSAAQDVALAEASFIAIQQPQKTRKMLADYLGRGVADLAGLTPDDKTAIEKGIKEAKLPAQEEMLLILALKM